MSPTPKRRPGARARLPKPRPARPKLDARLAFLLSLPPDRLRSLQGREDQNLRELSERIRATSAAIERESRDDVKREYMARLSALESQLFAPITTGVHFPPVSRQAGPRPGPFREPFASVFVLSDAGRRDLERLGVRVRSQAGDIFTCSVPISEIANLEASPAVQFIELARPVFPTLDEAIPYTQIDSLHTAQPAVTGAGAIVGIIDFKELDFYHPDFQTAAAATRVLFLWDQQLLPQAGESGPPLLPDMGASSGVEYNAADITAELNRPAGTLAYLTVRHGPATDPTKDHGTNVTGIAAGNGSGQGGTYTGAAPDADIIYVRTDLTVANVLSDNTYIADGFAYIFGRATLAGKPCSINMSLSDNQGPHDGMMLGEQFLDNLLLSPGRVITVSAGNSNARGWHATGSVSAGATADLILRYSAGASKDDDVEVWYDGHDRFDVTVTVPGYPNPIAVAPGNTVGPVVVSAGVEVTVTSVVDDPRNHDNYIAVMIAVGGAQVPTGNWRIALAGTTVINGRFHAWVDRNNVDQNGQALATWQTFQVEGEVTLAVPGTARRVITVGAHDKVGPPPGIYAFSGCGPTRDGRIKPEIATVGMNVSAPRAWDMNAGPRPAMDYVHQKFGTTFSAPLVAGACALLFQCRGATATWANLKQILEDTAGTNGIASPSNAFGFGFMRMTNACTRPPMNVDVWLKDHATDTGLEPFTGGIAWLSPDIEVLDMNGNPVPNPTYNPNARLNNLVRVTVRNRGTQTARNTEVYLYWGDPATNLPFPMEWKRDGIYTDPPPAFVGGTYTEQGNTVVIPQLAAGASAQVLFAWAPPAPGSNLHADNHFCLLVRLENEGDPSRVDAGEWAVITARNNIALRNVLVQQSPPEMSFYVIGTADQDSLIVYPELLAGRVELSLPVQALPWRDGRLIEKRGRPRLSYGHAEPDDPLKTMELTLKGEAVGMRTDVRGAERLHLRHGVVTFVAPHKARLFVPHVRLSACVRMPASIRVHRPKIDEHHRFVHVAQLSGGQLVGGVTLQLRAARS